MQKQPIAPQHVVTRLDDALEDEVFGRDEGGLQSLFWGIVYWGILTVGVAVPIIGAIRGLFP